jgi:hypothetical protein
LVVTERISSELVKVQPSGWPILNTNIFFFELYASEVNLKKAGK